MPHANELSELTRIADLLEQLLKEQRLISGKLDRHHFEQTPAAYVSAEEKGNAMADAFLTGDKKLIRETAKRLYSRRPGND